MKNVKDWRGNPIRIGSRVVWPSRQGSHLWMNEGVVEIIVPIEPKYRFGPAYKIGVRRIREQIRHGGSLAATNTGIVYPSVDRLTATGFFTAGVDREPVIGGVATDRMFAS